MDPPLAKQFGQIASRIRDQRYLFALAIAVACTFIPNPWLAATVIVGGFGLVYLVSWREHPKASERDISMALALEFPAGLDATRIILRTCRFTIADPRRPEDRREGEVKPYKAGRGWLCPLPEGTDAKDVVDLELEDSSGTKWAVYGFVPDLNWPPVAVQRVD